MKTILDTLSRFLRKCFPKYIETIDIISFQKYFKLSMKLLLFYTELWSYIFL